MAQWPHNHTGRRHRPTSPSDVAWTKTCFGASSSAFYFTSNSSCIHDPKFNPPECVNKSRRDLHSMSFGPGSPPGSQPNFSGPPITLIGTTCFHHPFQDFDGKTRGPYLRLRASLSPHPANLRHPVSSIANSHCEAPHIFRFFDEGHVGTYCKHYRLECICLSDHKFSVRGQKTVPCYRSSQVNQSWLGRVSVSSRQLGLGPG
jgi:hypothetical protein